jgi:hypothetical protein
LISSGGGIVGGGVGGVVTVAIGVGVGAAVGVGGTTVCSAPLGTAEADAAAVPDGAAVCVPALGIGGADVHARTRHVAATLTNALDFEASGTAAVCHRRGPWPDV